MAAFKSAVAQTLGGFQRFLVAIYEGGRAQRTLAMLARGIVHHIHYNAPRRSRTIGHDGPRAYGTRPPVCWKCVSYTFE